MNEQWNQARVRVSADEARHADPKPSAPPVPPVAFGGAPIRTAPKTRTIVAVGLALAAGGTLTVLVIAAAVVIGSSNQGDFPRRKTSVRAPSAAEEVSIDAGELGLVAPQVEGRGELGSEWSGSAVPWMVSRDGKLVLATNAHVAKGDGLAPTSLQIRFPAGKSLPVTAVAVANEPRIDVALMVVDAKGLKESVDFRCLAPGLEADWAALKPGLEVVAVGTPLGLPQTQTFGRVSATRDRLDGLSPSTRWIQYDATTMPGNSGGPLLSHSNGGWRWIGIVSALGPSGIGMAIHTSELERVKFSWIVGGPPEDPAFADGGSP